MAPTIPMMNSAEELEDEAERCLEEAESGMDEAAEFLTLGASEGSILDHYIIGARLGTSPDAKSPLSPFVTDLLRAWSHVEARNDVAHAVARLTL